MNTYKITFIADTGLRVETWSGYDEQTAISQCFLSATQGGARQLEVLSIEQK